MLLVSQGCNEMRSSSNDHSIGVLDSTFIWHRVVQHTGLYSAFVYKLVLVMTGQLMSSATKQNFQQSQLLGDRCKC